MCIYNYLYIYRWLGVFEHMHLYICIGMIICLSTHVDVREWASLLYEYGQFVSMSVDIYLHM